MTTRVASGRIPCPVCDGKGHISGLCECGCGMLTKIVEETNGGKGHRKGFPLRFINGHNRRKAPPTATGFWSQVDQGEGCWEWKGTLTQTGYGSFFLNGRARPAHRLSYELAVGPIPPGLIICHHCDNPPCVRPDHLYAGTNSENMLDMHRRGRAPIMPIEKHARGSRHGNSKLTEAGVLEIRTRYEAGGITQNALAAKYGVSGAVIGAVVNGRTWKHVLSVAGMARNP